MVSPVKAGVRFPILLLAGKSSINIFLSGIHIYLSKNRFPKTWNCVSTGLKYVEYCSQIRDTTTKFTLNLLDIVQKRGIFLIDKSLLIDYLASRSLKRKLCNLRLFNT